MLIVAGVAFVDQFLFTWRVVFCLCLHNKSAPTLKWTPWWMSPCAPQLAPRTLQRKPLRCALTRRLLVQMHGRRWKHCFRRADPARMCSRSMPVGPNACSTLETLFSSSRRIREAHRAGRSTRSLNAGIICFAERKARSRKNHCIPYVQSTLSRRPRQLIRSVLERILAWTHPRLTLRRLRGITPRFPRTEHLASLGRSTSLRSARLSSASG